MENYKIGMSDTSLLNQNSNHIELGIDSKILYDGKEVRGTISYEDICKYIKIGIFENGDKNDEHLVIRNEYIKGVNLGAFSLGMEGISYIELEHGTELLRYEYFRDLTKEARNQVKPVASCSDNYKILEEKSFEELLLHYENIYSVYNINDLLAIYHKHTNDLKEQQKKQVKTL